VLPIHVLPLKPQIPSTEIGWPVPSGGLAVVVGPAVVLLVVRVEVVEEVVEDLDVTIDEEVDVEVTDEGPGLVLVIV